MPCTPPRLARPELEIVVVVDWLRAQRGLIGAGKQPGNSAWYQEMTRTHEQRSAGVRRAGADPRAVRRAASEGLRDRRLRGLQRCKPE